MKVTYCDNCGKKLDEDDLAVNECSEISIRKSMFTQSIQLVAKKDICVKCVMDAIIAAAKRVTIKDGQQIR